MSKFLVFCADGTWSGPGRTTTLGADSAPTNVLKAYRRLEGRPLVAQAELAPEQEKLLADPQGRAVQLARYIDGVGDSSNWLMHALGGEFGAGTIVRIVRGYTFLSRNFEPGDRIVLLGFSRGAYTVRALSSLIADCGLLDRARLDLEDRNRAYAWGCAAWRAHRAATYRGSGLLHKLAEVVPSLDALLAPLPAPQDYVAAPIDAVAVWDTVGALGIPDIHEGVNVDLFRFVNLRLAPSVARALHAVSADEQRSNLTPTLWDADPRVLQVLFPGAHSDVGGGYPASADESGLSDCALHWMVGMLQRLGLAFAAPDAAFRPDPAGVAHAPWRHWPWNQLPSRPRQLGPGLGLARSLVERLALPEVLDQPGADPAPYAPVALRAYLEGRAPRPGVPIVDD